MGGRGASSGNTGGRSTPDGKFTVGNIYRLQNYNMGFDYDYIVTDVTNKQVYGKIIEIRQGGLGQRVGSFVQPQVGSMGYNQAKLLKESEVNAKARGNRERKEIQSIRKKLDKAGIKYPAGSSLENLKYRYNAMKKIGKVK